MGHVTVDRIEDAWKKLNKAEHLAENDQTHAAVLECENALKELYKSADGMGFGVWFTGKEDSIRNDMTPLKNTTAPDEDDVHTLIEDCRTLVRATKDKVIPELHDRIDYDPTPTLRER